MVSNDDFEKALKGDERAQMRTIIEGLATQLKLLTMFITVVELKTTSYEMADAAMEYLHSQDSSGG
jgi:hypothetical protein